RVGLVGKRDSGGYYDRFRGRLIFPIHDVRARAIAFGGRVLPELARERDAKYVNSPETPLFNKSSQLYALDLAREGIAQEGCIVVMEGYTDVIMAHQHGVANAVAVLGTALGDRHIPLIRRFTDRIALVLDGDAAGQRRTLDILDNLLALFVANDVELRILTLPEGADPCDVIASQGSDAFRRLLDQSVDALQHKINAVTNGLEPAADTHRSAQAVESVLATLARALPAPASAASSALVREHQALVRLSRQFGVSDEALRIRLAALRRAARSRISASAAASDQDERPPVEAPSTWDRELIELILHCPEQIDELAESIGEIDVAAPLARSLYAVALDLHHQGVAPSFDSLMLALNDESAKSLLVDCDETGRLKSESDAQQR
ncbi:MAG: toprim domain-containing protein, partial [Planctomycetota bacterium]